MAEDKHWHVDRRVPIALLGGLLLQTFAIGWWAAGISERLTAVERDANKSETAAQIRITALETRQLDSEKLGVRVDERLRGLGETLARVESALRSPSAGPPR